MEKRFKYTGLKVLVIGLGVSGYAVAKLLHAHGALVCVNELSKEPSSREKVEELTKIGISYIGGGHDIAILHDVDLVVKNPGIPYYTPFIEAIMARKIPIITEPEVAMSLCKAKVIALTGTNGKTTTTMLLYTMLKNYADNVYFAGNIGVAFSEIVETVTKNDIIVLELSSFQLMGMPSFAPDIAMILNLGDAHLDYHKSKQEYIDAKLAIYKNSKSPQVVIINADDSLLVSEISKRKPMAETMFFSLDKKCNGAYLMAGWIFFKTEKICLVADIIVPGSHNLQNILAGIVAAKQVGCSNEAIIAALKSFAGVEHRLEYVCSFEGIRFYNDSKATNIVAAQVALSSFVSPTIWLAGGLDRGNDITSIIPFCQSVKMIITFGQSQEKFAALADKMRISCVKVPEIQQAVEVALDNAQANDVVLLSPACASWDQFENFEQRGNSYKKIVKELILARIKGVQL
ncbi:MAG: UDP-N-acetylmuramoyl-L-alanine--D-glutamate ligase [Culicoidibacterales bacterium]